MRVKTLIILSVIFASLALSSCEDKDDNTDNGYNLNEADSDDVYTNKWIYAQMQDLYLWSDQLSANPNFDQDPENFFKSIRYKVNQTDGDRFSYMSEDETKTKAASNNLGFDVLASIYFDSKISGNNSIVGFFVINVHKNSNAEKKGLKRGNIIYAINNTAITYDNYSYLYNLLQSASSVSLSVYDEQGERVTINNISGSNYDKNDPILLTKVIDTSGVKIGYIVYNKFERGDDSKYDIKFANIIDSMVNKAGVKDIVLDLRYNPGGYVISATYMASALVPNRSTQDIFQKLTYNSTNNTELSKKYGNTYLFQDKINNSIDIPKTNLNSLYVLATQNTASASEAVINGLRPYMKVVHIGTTTTGKDKGSWELRSASSKVKWTYNPLIFRVLNKDDNKLTGGNYMNGLTPDVEIDEWAEGYPMVKTTDGSSYPDLSNKNLSKGGLVTLGDTTEPLLAEAIAQITGLKRQKNLVKNIPTRIISADVPKLKQFVSQDMIVRPDDLIKE